MSRRTAQVLVFCIICLVFFAYFNAAKESIAPHAAQQRLVGGGGVRLLAEWKAYFEKCDNPSTLEECRHVGDYAYSLEMPGAQALSRIVSGLPESPDQVELVHAFSEDEAQWLEGQEEIFLVIPRAIQRSTRLLLRDQVLKSSGYDEDLFFAVDAKALARSGRVTLSFHVSELPWFGPADFPIALTKKGVAGDYLSLTVRTLAADNLFRIFMFGASLVVILLGVTLDHKRSFFILSLLFSGILLGRMLPFLVEQGLELNAFVATGMVVLGLSSMLTVPWFAADVLGARLSRRVRSAWFGSSVCYLAWAASVQRQTLYERADLMAECLAALWGLLAVASVFRQLRRQKHREGDVHAIAIAVKPVFKMLGLSAGCLCLLWANGAEFIDLRSSGLKDTMSAWSFAFPALMLLTAIMDVGFTSKTMEANARNFADNALIARDVRDSQAFQQQLIPAKRLAGKGWRVRSFYYPSLTLAGDWFDVREIEADGSPRFLAVCLADVVGHGVSAGMIASTVASHWGVWVDQAGECLREAAASPSGVDEKLPASLIDGFFGRLVLGLSALRQARDCSAAVLLIDLGKMRLHYALAGHPPPLRRYLGKTGILPGRGGRVQAGAKVPVESIELSGSETIFLYSDGIVTPGVGTSKWLKPIAQAEVPVLRLLSSMRSNKRLFRANRGLEDDMTLLAIELLHDPGAVGRKEDAGAA